MRAKCCSSSDKMSSRNIKGALLVDEEPSRNVKGVILVDEVSSRNVKGRPAPVKRRYFIDIRT